MRSPEFESFLRVENQLKTSGCLSGASAAKPEDDRGYGLHRLRLALEPRSAPSNNLFQAITANHSERNNSTFYSDFSK